MKLPSLRRRKPEPSAREQVDLCQRCGRRSVEWPRFFSQEFYEKHRCPSGRGHVYGLPADALARFTS